jgi:hypothetical protein
MPNTKIIGVLAITFFGAGVCLADPAPQPSQPATVDGVPPGGAPTPAATPPAAAETDDHLDPNKIICKREDMTGTRVSRWKICMTRREWEQRSSDEAADTRHSQRAQDFKNKDMPSN